MDGVTIKVSTSKLTTAAGDFKQTGKDINSMIKEMNSLASDIGGVIWQGEAQEKYRTKFSKFTESSNHLEEMITEHADALTEIAKEYETAETAAIEAAQALADNIF